jgi:hypothetical protein
MAGLLPQNRIPLAKAAFGQEVSSRKLGRMAVRAGCGSAPQRQRQGADAIGKIVMRGKSLANQAPGGRRAVQSSSPE